MRYLLLDDSHAKPYLPPMSHLKKILLILLLVLGIPFAPVRAEEAQEPAKDENGYKVNQDHVMNIPSDMKVNKFGGNVITPESDTDYMARKLDAQGKRIGDLESKLTALDARLKAVESKSSSVS